jgi:hypothetical protein
MRLAGEEMRAGRQVEAVRTADPAAWHVEKTSQHAIMRDD